MLLVGLVISDIGLLSINHQSIIIVKKKNWTYRSLLAPAFLLLLDKLWVN